MAYGSNIWFFALAAVVEKAAVCSAGRRAGDDLATALTGARYCA